MPEEAQNKETKRSLSEAYMDLSKAAKATTDALRKISQYIRIREADGDDFSIREICLEAWSANRRVKCTRTTGHKEDHVARTEKAEEIARWTNISTLPSFER